MDNALSNAVFAASLFNMNMSTRRKPVIHIDIDKKTARQLEKLSLSELYAVLTRADQFITVHVDEAALQIALGEAANDNDYAELQDQYILNNASGKIMQHFFGMSSNSFTERRSQLGLEFEGQHRPPNCDEETEILIWKVYQRFSHLDIRHRYLKVAQVADVPIRQVIPAIEKYEVPDVPA